MMLPERFVLATVHSHDARPEEASPQRSATCVCFRLIAEGNSELLACVSAGLVAVRSSFADHPRKHTFIWEARLAVAVA